MKRYFQSRLIARVSKELPLIFSVPLFLLGQYSALSYCVLLTVIPILCITLSRSPRILLRALAIFGLGGALAWTALPTDNSTTLSELSGGTLIRISQQPRRTMPGGATVVIEVHALVRAQEGAYHLDSLSQPPLLTCRTSELPWRNISKLEIGDWHLARISARSFADESRWGQAMRRRGIAGQCRILYASQRLYREQSWISEIRAKLKARIIAISGDSEASGLLRSLLLGDRDTLTRQTESSFKRTALAHLLVVSGYHISINFALIFGLLSLVLSRWRTLPAARLLIFAVPLVFCFIQVLISGAHPPAVRAMTAIALYALLRLLDRTPGAPHALLLSLLIICCIWPLSFLDVGVQFTYAALFGIFLACPPQTTAYRSKGFRSALWQYLKIHLLPSLTTAIVSLIHFGYMSLIGFILQPTLAPIIALVGCKGGMLALLTDWITAGKIQFPVRWVVGILAYLRDLLLNFSSIKLATFEPEGGSMYLTLMAASLIVLWLFSRRILGYRQYYNLRASPSTSHLGQIQLFSVPRSRLSDPINP